ERLDGKPVAQARQGVILGNRSRSLDDLRREVAGFQIDDQCFAIPDDGEFDGLTHFLHQHLRLKILGGFYFYAVDFGHDVERLEVGFRSRRLRVNPLDHFPFFPPDEPLADIRPDLVDALDLDAEPWAD